MLTIKIYNEFIHSPIWTYGEDGIVTSDPPVIENDERLQSLCEQIDELYSSYFEFNYHGQACWFDFEKEKADKEIMLSLLNRLISRLNEINDGSLTVEDCETKRVKSL